MNRHMIYGIREDANFYAKDCNDPYYPEYSKESDVGPLAFGDGKL